MNSQNIRLQDEMLKRDIMRRVRTVYFMRRVSAALVNRFTVESVALAVFVGASASMMSVSNVISNMSRLGSSFDGIIYLYEAFLHTSFAVEISLVLATATGAWLVVDLARQPFVAGSARRQAAASLAL